MSEEQRLLIQKSKEFAERVLIDGVIEGSTEEYCIFVVGKFMLTKELVLQKNHETRNIFFNAARNPLIKNAMLDIARYVKENNTQLITNIRGVDTGYNTIGISIEPQSSETSELIEAVWIVNKIRDSIAHGCYHIDFQREIIVIKNNKNISDGYALVCEIPLVLLNSFFERDISVYYVYNKYIKKEDVLLELSAQMLFNLPKIEFVPEIKTENDIEKNIKVILAYDAKKLYNIFRYIQESDSVDKKAKNEMNRLIQKRFKNALSILNYPNDCNYNTQRLLRNLFEELETIMRKHNKSRTSISLIAMHNYLQNVFGFIHLDNPKIKDNLYLVDMSRFRINRMENQTVTNLTNSIKTETQRYIDSIGPMINDFNHMGQINRISNITVLFFHKIIELLNNRNYIILSSMRNGIEHTIISEENDEITIRDMKDQTDREEENFSCTSDYEGLYALSNKMESLERATQSELADQKQEFFDTRIVDAIANATGDKTLAMALFGCLNVVQAYIAKAKETTSVAELTDSYRETKVIELEALLMHRQDQLGSQGGTPKL